jgi:hypothetical protein
VRKTFAAFVLAPVLSLRSPAEQPLPRRQLVLALKVPVHHCLHHAGLTAELHAQAQAEIQAGHDLPLDPLDRQ